MGKTLPWKTKLAALQKFKEREGHTLVRQSFVDPESGFRLGRWVANLRQRADFLTESQLDDLERLDFVWSRFKVLPWEMKISILRKYRNQHGHTLVPKDYVDSETDFHLGWWVDRMRQGKNTMNQNRIKDLEDLGFVWNAFDATWETMFRLLQEYKAEHRHACPKINEHFKGKPLGHWVGMQRQLYSRKVRSAEEGQTCNATTVISDKRVEQLNQIGFVWRLRTSGAADYDDTFNDTFTTVTDGSSSNSLISSSHRAMNTSASYAAGTAGPLSLTPSPLATPMVAPSSALSAPATSNVAAAPQQVSRQQLAPTPSSLTPFPGMANTFFSQQMTSNGGNMAAFPFMQGAAAAAAAAAAHLQFPSFRLDGVSQQLAQSSTPAAAQSYQHPAPASLKFAQTSYPQAQAKSSHSNPPVHLASDHSNRKIPAMERYHFPTSTNNDAVGTSEQQLQQQQQQQPSKESPITDETLLSSLAFLASSSGGNSPETSGNNDLEQPQQQAQATMHHPQHVGQHHHHMPNLNGNDNSTGSAEQSSEQPW
eukprot:CAMPEP_0168722498 /NCGR_PEP_ID=MMETSP0724-20121128/2628_1 /TAXON_ID=265536 /ORGANISM="Amphiprora sp., Strain CCMP467" /LENGTH=536 /DNA_ID=CAMNT_0008769171 /DNA_START=441 /DNA_END=2048 /DNA_ORIENTATION=+